MKYCWTILIVCFLYGQSVGQQTTGKLTLKEALLLAQTQSVEALEALSKMRIAYWEYRSFKANLYPSLILSGTLPHLNKSLSSYQNEDGSYRFVPNRSISENLSLALSQNIPQTGGNISVESNLQRQDQLGDKNTTTYLSVPVSLTLNQPLITFNSLKWQKRIEPLKYQEAQKQFAVNMENVAIKTINYYFDFLLAIVNKNIAAQNLKNSTALYDIALGKKKLGLISENDVQQLKLGKLKASASVVTVQQNYEKKLHNLCNFLGMEDNRELSLEIPSESPVTGEIGFQEIMEIVNRNNPRTEHVKRRLLEAQRQLAQARSDRGFQLNVYASIGFTNTDPALPDSYRNLQNRQQVNIGVRIPILDWGKGRARVEAARNSQLVEEVRIRQETDDFEQNIRMLLSESLNQPYLTEIYRQADSLAHNRYRITYETFVMGKISVIDINTAQSEEDEARRNYINQLYMSWLYHYNLRQVTLYDFINKKDLINDINPTLWTEKLPRK